MLTRRKLTRKPWTDLPLSQRVKMRNRAIRKYNANQPMGTYRTKFTVREVLEILHVG